MTKMLRSIGKNIVKKTLLDEESKLALEIESIKEKRIKEMMLSKAITFKVVSTNSPVQRYCLIVIMVETEEVVAAIEPNNKAMYIGKLNAHISKPTPTVAKIVSNRVITTILPKPFFNEAISK